MEAQAWAMPMPPSPTARRASRVRAAGNPPGAANRKHERLERRELLYAVVREAMIQGRVLSSSYKFKVLSLDARGRQYLMMDLATQRQQPRAWPRSRP